MPKLKLPLRDIQDDEPAAYCGKCLGEVYSEETMFEWEGKRICSDCFKHEVSVWLEHTPEQVANAIGFSFGPASQRKEPL